MATLAQKFADHLGELDFDIDDLPANTDDVGRAAFIAKIQALEDLLLPGGELGCWIGCLPSYLQCKKDNPVYPPQAICDALLANCISNCNQQ